MNRIRFILFITLTALCAFLSACVLGTPSPTSTPVIYMPTRSAATLPPPTQAPACENRMLLDEDEDALGKIYVSPGTKFLQEWVVTNYSSCNWDEQYHLFFVSGSQMGAPDYVEIPHIPIGSKGKISIELTAPTEPGEYRSEWKLFGSDNRFFGESLTVEIIVLDTY